MAPGISGAHSPALPVVVPVVLPQVVVPVVPVLELDDAVLELVPVLPLLELDDELELLELDDAVDPAVVVDEVLPEPVVELVEPFVLKPIVVPPVTGLTTPVVPLVELELALLLDALLLVDPTLLPPVELELLVPLCTRVPHAARTASPTQAHRRMELPPPLKLATTRAGATLAGPSSDEL